MAPQTRTETIVMYAVYELNHKFNIGIKATVPNDTMSPADRRASGALDRQYARWDKICISLRFLSRQKEGNLLEEALADFEREATAVIQTWLTSDELGSRRRLEEPRAETEGQQVILQDLLVKILDKFAPITPSVSKFPDRLAGTTSTRKSNASKSTTTPRNLSTPSKRVTSTFSTRVTRSASKREAMMDEDDSMSPADPGGSPPKKHKGRQRAPIDEPVPCKLGTMNPLDAVLARERVTEGTAIDPLGRPLTAGPVVYQNGHHVDRSRSTNSNLRTEDWVANNDPDIVPEDSVSAIVARVGHPAFEVSTSSRHQFTLPTHHSQPPNPQHSLPSRPAHPEPDQREIIWISDDSASERSFHSAASASSPVVNMNNTNNVGVNTNHASANMNHVTGSHHAHQPAGFPDPVAISNQAQYCGGAPPVQHVGGITPPSHQVVQNVGGIPTPVTLGKTVTPSLANQHVPATPPSSPATVQDRLDLVWPKIPRWLEDAPLAVIWEVTRIGLHCKVDLETLDNMRYNPDWVKGGIKSIWADFRKLDEGREDSDCIFKSFPEPPSSSVFETALGTFATPDSSVVMSASLDWNKSSKGTLFHVTMRPLHLEQGCRLNRRFGADRFFEILIPSLTDKGPGAPACMKNPENVKVVTDWLVKTKHEFVGRLWQAFFTKSAGSRKPPRDYRLEPDAKPVFKERVNFFAESGYTFQNLRPTSWVPMADEPLHRRYGFKASQMLDWLLCLENNQDQPYLKLFSRIQLGLSQTTPILVFQQDQMRHLDTDMLSPTGKVMNDGIGLMSRAVARKVRDRLGLTDIPSAIQGRIGSAKGMWLIDVNDPGDNLWITTYPSQRKWRCDQTDEYQRTFEVHSTSTELRSAGLNLQLLPVLETRARDKELMRAAISKRLAQDLEDQFKGQQDAFNDPILLRQWMAANFNGRASRVKNGSVPMLGGMPESKEEGVLMLLNSNFVPSEQKHMAKMIWDLQMQKCEQLKTKLNIKVSQSAYVYMVVDFWDVLAEGEVHLGFSNKFHAEGSDESLTLLTNRDVLVTRSPAHFPSDIQKVRAVFKSELASLKDVIVFSARGNVPLADMLSGGDYDGDQAWVCWDQEIVGSFENDDVPEQPDLSKYMEKEKTTFEELVEAVKALDPALCRELAVNKMILEAFHFAFQQNFLGICTNFKERACYWRGNVKDKVALHLSTLVGQLVDQSKQGIKFNMKSWKLLQNYLAEIAKKDDPRKPLKESYDNPIYKANAWTGEGSPKHIIDHLKFNVAIPVITKNLMSLHELSRRSKEAENDSASPEGGAAFVFDRDLCKLSKHQDALAAKSKTHAALLEALDKALRELLDKWRVAMALKSPEGYVAKVRRLHEAYRAITLETVAAKSKLPQIDPKTISFLGQPAPGNNWVADPDRWSMWALVKASRGFKLFYHFGEAFIFQMAGEQLAYLKAMATVRPDAGLAPVLTPLMWAGTGCDQRFAKQWTAKRLGDEATEYLGEGAVDRARPEVFGEWDDGWKADGEDGW